MVVDVKLCKEEGKPFGFRLIGGADFEIPLTCSKVSDKICRKKNKKKRKYCDNFLSKSFSTHNSICINRSTLNKRHREDFAR